MHGGVRFRKLRRAEARPRPCRPGVSSLKIPALLAFVLPGTARRTGIVRSRRPGINDGFGALCRVPAGLLARVNERSPNRNRRSP